MSIENSKYFAAGDAGDGPEKNNEQKQTPEKKEIKIDPNNFDEEEIEKIFKEPETTETEKGEQSEEPQQTPEQTLKDQVEEFLAERLVKDTSFFSKDITSEEFRNWQDRNQVDFKNLPEEKQKMLMEMLGNKLKGSYKDIEITQKILQNILREQPIDEALKQQFENDLKYLQNQQKAVRARTQAYHLALHPDKQQEQPPKAEEQKEEPLDKQLETIIKEIRDGKITPDAFLKFISTPGVGEVISKNLNSSEFQDAIKDPENQNKIKKLIDKFQNLIGQEKEKPKPETVEKVKEFIKSEEKKGKESIFQKMGGWNTVGGIAGFSFMMFLILIFLGEFKLLEKTSDIGGGGGKGEKGGKH